MKKRLLSIVLLALMIMILLPAAAFAAEKTGDDLYVRQTTDKATYGPEEYIITTLSVTNTNDSAHVRNLRLKNYTPDGYYVVSGYSSETYLKTLRAGDTVVLRTKLAHTNAPATGDDSAGSLLLYAGMALASAAVFIWLVGSKKLRRYISMFLVCCMLAGFIPFVGNEAAFAEENQTKEISLSTTVKVGQNNRTVYSSVFYTVPVAVTPAVVAGLTYNGKEQTGVLPGEGYTLTGNKATGAGEHSATATLEAGYRWPDGSTNAKTVQWAMDKAEASVNPNPATKVYGEDDPALTAEVTGVKDGDTLNYTLKREAGENVGTYAITAELGENPNYDVTTGEAEFTITRKGVAIPTAVTGLIYNGTEQTGVAEATAYTVTDGKATNAGSYTATATLAEGYKWSDDTTEAKQIEWSIAKTPLTATADDKSVTVGDAAPAYTVTYTGWVNGESIETVTPTTAAVLACEYTTTSVAGEYDITFTTEPKFANYTVTAVPGKLTAAPAPTTYTVTFDLNGISGTAPDAQTITSGETVTKPADPTDMNHTFAGWYKTKDATTGTLSDPWDFTNDTVTENITLYAQWTRTLASILTTNLAFPSSTNTTAPGNAWVNGDGNKAFVANSTGNAALMLAGSKTLSCRKTENFTKIGEKYIFEYMHRETSYGVFTLHMTDGTLTSVTYNGAGTDFEVLNGTYTAPAAPKLLRSPLHAPTPVAEDGLQEERPETEAVSALSELEEVEQAGGTETVEETVESAPTPVLGGILDTVDLNNVHWGDGNGKECYISGDNLVFTNSSGTYEIGLDAALTQNGGDWMLEKDSVTITFVMKDGTLDQIVYVGDGSFDAVYSVPAEEEETEEDEPTIEEPVEEVVEETVEESVTEDPITEAEPETEEPAPEEEPVPESEPEEPVEQKPEEQTEPAEPEEVTEQTDPVEETEPAAEE